MRLNIQESGFALSMKTIQQNAFIGRTFSVIVVKVCTGALLTFVDEDKG